MATSLEGNKLLAAILTAGIMASAAGTIATMLYKPHELEKPAYTVAVEEAAPAEAAAPAEPEQPLAALLAAADPAAGESDAKKCSACHSFDEGGANKVGPGLHGVVGRTVGTHAGFSYSSAMGEHGGTWGYEELFHFLADPKAYVAGTKMSFAGIKKAEDRANVIAYLRSISPDAPPLPE